MTYTSAILSLALVAAPAAVRAEMNGADSLEWMTADSTLVVCGRLLFPEVEEKNRRPRLTLRVEDVLKGECPEKEIHIDVAGHHDPKVGWHTDRSYLFFLRKAEIREVEDAATSWVPRDHSQYFIDLQQLDPAFLADMRIARSVEEIRSVVSSYRDFQIPDAVRTEKASSERRRLGTIGLSLPFGNPIFQRLWLGSGVILYVPIDSRSRERVLELARSEDVGDRAAGAYHLAKFPGPETVAVLSRLLEDSGEDHARGEAGEPLVVKYRVRRAAFDALEQLGEKPVKPMFERPPTRAELLAKARSKQRPQEPGTVRWFQVSKIGREIYEEKLEIELDKQLAERLFVPEKPWIVENWRELVVVAIEGAPKARKWGNWMKEVRPPKDATPVASVVAFSSKEMRVMVLKPLDSEHWTHSQECLGAFRVARSADLDLIFGLPRLEATYGATVRGLQQGDCEEAVLLEFGPPDAIISTQAPDYFHNYYFEQDLKITFMDDAIQCFDTGVPEDVKLEVKETGKRHLVRP